MRPPFIPSEQLLKEVRAALMLKGSSLSAVCKAHGLVRQNVSAALTGQWKGPKATALATSVFSLDMDKT